MESFDGGIIFAVVSPVYYYTNPVMKNGLKDFGICVLTVVFSLPYSCSGTRNFHENDPYFRFVGREYDDTRLRVHRRSLNAIRFCMCKR